VENEPDSAALSGAKQQLEEMKTSSAATGAGLDTKLAPQLPVTQLSLSSDYVAPAAKPKSDLQKRRQSENWLVDGVMRADAKDRASQEKRNASGLTTDARGAGNATTRLGENGDNLLGSEEDEGGGAFDAQRLAIETSASPRTNSPSSAPDKTGGRDSNPFAGYLAGWLSPQDLSLLRNAADAPASGFGSSGSTSGSAAPVELSQSAGNGGIDAFTEHGTGAATKPGDNPFLQFLKTPDTPALSTPAPAADPAPTSLPATATLPALPDAAARSAVPDFAKPAFDDKYLKPLKRF